MQDLQPGQNITFSPGTPTPTQNNTPQPAQSYVPPVSSPVLAMPVNAPTSSNAPSVQQAPSYAPFNPQQQQNMQNTQSQVAQQPAQYKTQNSNIQQTAPNIGPQRSSLLQDNALLPNDDFLDDDDDFLDDPLGPLPPPSRFGASQQQNAVSLSKMPEDQRRDIITRIFKLVLGKDPAEKDFNYYRFSALTEEGLIRNLLNLNEHKISLENAKQFSILKSSNSELELKVKFQESQLLGMRQEIIALQDLLQEKNRHIANLRGESKQYQGVSTMPHLSQTQQMNSSPVEYSPGPAFVSTNAQPEPFYYQSQTQGTRRLGFTSFFEGILSMLRSLFSR